MLALIVWNISNFFLRKSYIFSEKKGNILLWTEKFGSGIKVRVRWITILTRFFSWKLLVPTYILHKYRRLLLELKLMQQMILNKLTYWQNLQHLHFLPLSWAASTIHHRQLPTKSSSGKCRMPFRSVRSSRRRRQRLGRTWWPLGRWYRPPRSCLS